MLSAALYVTDCLNHRVVAYDAALHAPLLSFGRRGIADDLSHPAGIALHDGDLFVADAGNRASPPSAATALSFARLAARATRRAAS